MGGKLGKAGLQASRQFGALARLFGSTTGNLIQEFVTRGFKAYFFLTFLIYFTGAVVALSTYTYVPRREDGEIVCPMTLNVYFLCGAFFIQGFLAAYTAWGYSYIEKLPEGSFTELSAFQYLIGFMIKVVPTWSRLLHVFNFFQLLIAVFYALVLPECNLHLVRVTLFVLGIVWWCIILVGITAKRHFPVPPTIFEPVRPATGLLQELHTMLRALGP
ncbi:unnamed protein product [Vitrella brassicaformis CCMP3155]|uniref:Uncharacterized protein n=2 Tax=Vitrella brassicaformis TaxID=1169539 RepID=A0A0G4EF81_VITBC|nr:unnamed protein product [Vitrella brassicaformis CCMP3155]|eukprot:CEL94390.1 unnamed protein product [Vitrella brassicaformis CCMP3155]